MTPPTPNAENLEEEQLGAFHLEVLGFYSAEVGSFLDVGGGTVGFEGVDNVGESAFFTVVGGGV